MTVDRECRSLANDVMADEDCRNLINCILNIIHTYSRNIVSYLSQEKALLQSFLLVWIFSLVLQSLFTKFFECINEKGRYGHDGYF